MASIEAAKKIAADFDYSDEHVRKSVRHFMKQMSMAPTSLHSSA
jgi:hypothetical protein